MAAACALLTCPSAASISAGVIFSVPAVTLARSNLLVSSTSATSPRARTSAMMPRTTAATSSSSSRLVKSRSWNCWANVASDSFSLRAICGLVIGGTARRPGAADVRQLGVDAFHRQAQGAAAGQHDLDHPAGIFAAIGNERRRQDGDHCFTGAQLDLAGLHLQHTVEMQAGAQARLAAIFPGKPVHHRREAPLPGQPDEILELDHGVLQTGR